LRLDPDKGAVERPLIEAVAQGVPVGNVGGKEPLLAAGTGEIEQGIDHLAPINDDRTTHVVLSFNQRLAHLPLLIGHIGRIRARGDRELRQRGLSSCVGVLFYYTASYVPNALSGPEQPYLGS
jgi:hypothetical protein